MSQLGVISTQCAMEALVSDCYSAVHTLSLGNLSIAPWVRVSLIWQGNLAGNALILCYWVSSQQSFIALIHQNTYCLELHLAPALKKPPGLHNWGDDSMRPQAYCPCLIHRQVSCLVNTNTTPTTTLPPVQSIDLTYYSR